LAVALSKETEGTTPPAQRIPLREPGLVQGGEKDIDAAVTEYRERTNAKKSSGEIRL